jgi:hypothetical protein
LLCADLHDLSFPFDDAQAGGGGGFGRIFP